MHRDMLRLKSHRKSPEHVKTKRNILVGLVSGVATLAALIGMFGADVVSPMTRHISNSDDPFRRLLSGNSSGDGSENNGAACGTTVNE